MVCTEPRGLSGSQAAARLSENGPNVLPVVRPPTIIARAARQAREPLSLLLLGAALISAVVLRHGFESVAIAMIVVLNIAVGTAQEHRASIAIDALARLAAPTARVRRDGHTVVVPAADVVVGDVVELMAGDRVPADVELVEGVALAIDEAVLTGESMPVTKHAGSGWREDVPLADRSGAAFASTMVVRGRAVGLVRATGTATAVGAIAASLATVTEPPLVRELRTVAGRMSAVAVVLGALMVPLFVWRSDGRDIVDAFVAGIAIAIAAVPEGLATVVVTALALGARTMAHRGAIVRTLPAIETLGCTTVLCTDKTGTLTTGHLSVASTVLAPSLTSADALWGAALRCNDATDGVGDPIDVAIVAAATEAGVVADAAERRIAERPFDADDRVMATVHATAGGPRLSVKGAPEVVLGRCAAGADRDALLGALPPLLARGARVLAVADGVTRDVAAHDLRPLGLIAFADPLRDTTRAAVEDCRRAGIRVVMVTGDHQQTAEAVAEDAGLPVAPAVTGASVAALPAAERAEALRRAAVVARVEPATKVELVEAHQAVGDVVAMTGDGVNDAPALRHADIGIAIAGETGTDIARDAAELVVTNGDLSTLAAAVREGRRIYRNLAAVVSYLLAGNVSEVLVVVGSLVLLPSLAVPLLPVQLLWVNLVTDGLPALALGVDHAPSDPLDGPPRRASERMLGWPRLRLLLLRAAMTAAAVLGSAAITRTWGWTESATRAQLLLSLLGAHLILAYVTRAQRWTFESGWWRNRTLALATGVSLAAQVPVFGTSLGRELFALDALPWTGWLLAAGTAVVVVALADGVRRLPRLTRLNP